MLAAAACVVGVSDVAGACVWATVVAGSAVTACVVGVCCVDEATAGLSVVNCATAVIAEATTADDSFFCSCTFARASLLSAINFFKSFTEPSNA